MIRAEVVWGPLGASAHLEIKVHDTVVVQLSAEEALNLHAVTSSFCALINARCPCYEDGWDDSEAENGPSVGETP